MYISFLFFFSVAQEVKHHHFFIYFWAFECDSRMAFAIFLSQFFSSKNKHNKIKAMIEVTASIMFL